MHTFVAVKRIIALVIASMLTLSCTKKQNAGEVVTPWGETTDNTTQGDIFDLDEIQQNGELIALTLNGPDTYYEYRCKHLGTQYLMAERFAASIGVSLRMEICRDTAEMLRRLAEGNADIICCRMDTAGSGWRVGNGKKALLRELQTWYRPSIAADVQREENFLLSAKSVRRRIFSPMLNQKGGVISHFDAYFQKYSATIRWDWRLMAAQCYQESTFDPQARSWAGACGLMQIMPSTADHLGLAQSEIFNPEKNIEAASRYLAELNSLFADIGNAGERTKFVLAAYNGGHFHIRDAMALAQKAGRSSQRWTDVEPFVLGLSQPQYYNDPIVKHGYMRGSETADYVKHIMLRWNTYRGVRTPQGSFSPAGTPQKARHERKQKYQITEMPK